MISVLAIGLDYLMLKKDSVRGDVRERQLDYAKHLSSLKLVVYSPKHLGLKTETWSDNLKVYPTNSKNKLTFLIDAYKICSSICKETKIDIITTEDPFIAGLVGFLLKKRYKAALNIQTHVDFYNNRYWLDQRKINWLFNKLGGFILKKADTIRVGTHYEKEKLSTKLKIDKNKIQVIPVNSDLNKFTLVNGDILRKKYCNHNFNKILLFTGRLVPQKDIATLLRAFTLVLKERPGTLLLITGSGREENVLKKLSTELKISNKVLFTGSIEHGQIPEYLSACDIYTISSIFEGTCIAMTEAMASGKPVVATKFAGAIDLIDDGKTGFIVEQKDYKTMSEKILFLLNNPQIAADMGKKGSLKIKSLFANNINIEAVVNLWEKTAKNDL